jgi:tagaturonate epimerase
MGWRLLCGRRSHQLEDGGSFYRGQRFFTLDVAEEVGKPSSPQVTEQFLAAAQPYLGTLTIPGIAAPFAITREVAIAAADKFLFAIQTAGQIYRHVEAHKGQGRFVTEISVDETDRPQTPAELFLILAMIAQEKIPAQTIAPKFTGRFNKGADYVGDLAQFEKEFEQDLHVLAFGIREFGFPPTLKLSVHSGSDKFSLYPIIRKLIQKHQVGLHVKTAGTTWLEELIGLAEAGGEGLAIAREIYIGAMGRFIELTQPYANVIDIDPPQLPSTRKVATWSSDQFVRALRYDSECPD